MYIQLLQVSDVVSSDITVTADVSQPASKNLWLFIGDVGTSLCPISAGTGNSRRPAQCVGIGRWDGKETHIGRQVGNWEKYQYWDCA